MLRKMQQPRGLDVQNGPVAPSTEIKPVPKASPSAAARRIEVRVEVCSERKPEVKLDSGSEGKPEAKSELSAEHKPAVKPEPRPSAERCFVVKSQSQPVCAGEHVQHKPAILQDDLLSFKSRSEQFLAQLDTNYEMQRSMFQDALAYVHQLESEFTQVRSCAQDNLEDGRPDSRARQDHSHDAEEVQMSPPASPRRASLSLEAGTVKRRVKEYERATSEKRRSCKELPRISPPTMTKSASWSAFPRDGSEAGWLNSRPTTAVTASVSIEPPVSYRLRSPQSSAARSLSVRERICALQSHGLNVSV